VFVIDTSVTMAWCFEDETTEAADAVLDRLREETAAAPTIWPLEVTNVLLVAERRGRLSEAQVARFLELLRRLPIDVNETSTDLASAVSTGRQHRLSSYDASYLVLAQRLGAPLATFDERLAAAARAAGVQLLVTSQP
jgi:predicted nucleic acid-binding protein